MFVSKPPAVRKRVLEYASRPTPTEFSQERRGATIGDLNRAVAEWAQQRGLFRDVAKKADQVDITDDNRHLLLGWLLTPDDQEFRPMSSKDLTPQQWHGLAEWIGSEKIAGEWRPRDAFVTEANWILTRAKQLQHAIASGRQITMAESIEEWAQFEPESGAVDVDPGGQVAQAVSYLGATIGRIVEGADAQLEAWYDEQLPNPFIPRNPDVEYTDVEEAAPVADPTPAPEPSPAPPQPVKEEFIFLEI